MSNTYTIPNPNLRIFNHTGNLSLTGYCLTISTFTFTVSNVFNNGRVFWDFGDGASSTNGLTAQHSYNDPGVYNINCFLYDMSGNVYKSTYTPTISVTNFITDSLTLSSNTNVFQVSAGRINTGIPIKIIRKNSWQTWPSLSSTGYTLNLYTSGGTANYFDQGLDSNKYGNLYPYSSFYNKVGEEYIETTTTSTNNTLLFCKLKNNTINLCGSADSGSIFCGTSGIGDLYFKDDLPYGAISLYVNFDRNTFSVNDFSNCINTVAVGLCAKIVGNVNYNMLSITSNGLDGEGNMLTSFNIDINKFVNLPINFVVRIKDSNLFNIKNVNLLSIGNNTNQISLTTVDNTGKLIPLGTIISNFSYLSSLTAGGFYKGVFKANSTANNIRLSAYGNINGKFITGVSTPFNIYAANGVYNIAKINEDFDLPQVYKDLRFQDFLTDDTILFDEFFTSIYGTASSSSSCLGKTANERIANFVSNKVDINSCDIDSLLSLNELFDSNMTNFYQSNLTQPAKFKRLVDLISINHSRLWGTTNKFNLNFDDKYSTDASKYGLNLGAELNVATTVLTSYDSVIIAFEKYSGKYKRCSTFIPVEFLTTYTQTGSVISYPLSSYSDNWGWGLVTGGVSGVDVGRYYKFFRYKNVVDGTVVNNIINFNDITNTVSISLSSYTDWVKDGGVVDNMVCHTLYTGVKLLSS